MSEPEHSAGEILLRVDVAQQRLAVWRGDTCLRAFDVSTSRHGIGSREGSHQTPPGRHEVVERYGDGLPAGTVFVSREPTGEVLPPERWAEGGDRDLILTRILRLAGLEDGVNRGPGLDAYARYIYLHGTNQEQRIGTPASRGCIRLRNLEMIELFELTRGARTFCLIEPPPEPGDRRGTQTAD